MVTQHRGVSKPRSRSSKPRVVLNGGKNVCAICFNPKKHKAWCEKRTRLIQTHVEITPHSEASNISTSTRDIESNEIDPTIESYLRDVWERQKNTLPPLSNFTKDGELDRSKWPTWKFSTPDPYMDSLKKPTHLEMCIGSVDVYVWCPHTFFSHFLSNFDVKCVACGDSIHVTLNGWTKFRTLVGISTNSYLICRRYKHVNCPAALSKQQTTTTFSAINSKFFSSLPLVVQAQMDFLIKEKIAYTSDVVTYSREMQQYCSFKSASAVHHTMIKAREIKQERKYLLAMIALRNPGKICMCHYLEVSYHIVLFEASIQAHMNQQQPPEFAGYIKHRFASAYMLREMAVDRLKVQEPYMHAHMQNLKGTSNM